MLNEKDRIFLLVNGLIRKDIIQMSEFFPEPKYSEGRVKIQSDLSNIATNVDLKNAPGADTSDFAKKNWYR